MENPINEDEPLKNYFVLLVGVPGSGKSTFAQSVQNHVILSTDDIIEGIAQSAGKTYSDVFSTTIDPATRIMEGWISLLTAQKANVVVDRTNLTRKSRKKIMELVQNKQDYTFVCVVFNTPDELVDKRIEERNSTGKVISKSVLKRMRASYEKPSKSEGFHEIVEVNLSKSPEESSVIINNETKED